MSEYRRNLDQQTSFGEIKQMEKTKPTKRFRKQQEQQEQQKQQQKKAELALTEAEIRMILRGADVLIAVGGRNLLAKLLKGSREKIVLEHGLDQCPAYGFYRDLTIPKITERIDLLIRKDYLRIEYNWKLPMLVFSEKGWAIEAETYAAELYEMCRAAVESESGEGQGAVETETKVSVSTQFPDMKETNRQVVFEVLERIRISKDRRYIPYLEQWRDREVQKVRARITAVIASLENPKKESEYGLFLAKRENWREIMNLIHRAAGAVYSEPFSENAADLLDWLYSRQTVQRLIDDQSLWILKRCGLIIGTGQIQENRIMEVYELPEDGEAYGMRMIQALEGEVKKKYPVIELEWSLPDHEQLEQAGYRMKQFFQAGVLSTALRYAVFQKE